MFMFRGKLFSLLVLVTLLVGCQGLFGRPVEEEAPTPDIAAVGEQAKADTGGKSEKVGNAGDSIKAPVDWGPKDREAWSSIPRHLQDKVMQREKDMAAMMQQMGGMGGFGDMDDLGDDF